MHINTRIRTLLPATLLLLVSPAQATSTGAYGTDCTSCHVDGSGSPWTECGKDFYCSARSELGVDRDFDTDSNFTDALRDELKESAGIAEGSCGSASTETYASLDSSLCSDSGGDDEEDTASCEFDRGRVTFQNTVEKIMDTHCIQCHAPRLTDLDLGSGYAVEPANLVHLHTWSNINTHKENVVAYTLGGVMPPPQSQLPLSEDELEDLEAWQDAGYPRGSDVGRIEILNVTDATSRTVSVQYQAEDTQGLWESLALRLRSATPTLSLMRGDDPDAHVAIFKTQSSSGFDPANDTLVADCLSLGTVALGFTLPEEETDGILRALTGYSIYGCVYDKDNVYCDRWPERLNFRTPVLSP